MTRGVSRSGLRAAPRPPTPENAEIANHVAYDPATGEFTWRRDRSTRVRAGSRAGSVWRRKGDARYVIRFDNRGYQGNRVAWLIMTGEWPVHQIDHRDGDSLNNAWDNLRQATHSQNCANARRRRDNTSGFKGVCARPSGKFASRIQHGGRRLNLGLFDTAEDAHAAYVSAMKQLHQSFGRAA